MFTAIKSYLDVSKLIKATERCLAAREGMETSASPHYWKSGFPIRAGLTAAAEVARGTPRLEARVIDAIEQALQSPIMPAQDCQALLATAHTLPLNGRITHHLSTYTSPADKSGPNESLTLSYVSLNGLQRSFEAKAQKIILAIGAQHGEEAQTRALCTLANMACDHDNWKTESLLTVIGDTLAKPAQMDAVLAAEPRFTAAVLAHRVDSHRLRLTLTEGVAAFPRLTAAHAQLRAETALYALAHFNPISRTSRHASYLRDAQRYAKQEPSYRPRLAETLIESLPVLVRMGAFVEAEHSLDVLNRISGSPLGPFTELASRELCLGPVADYETSSAASPTAEKARIFVACAPEWTSKIIQHTADDLSHFTLLHGTHKIGTMDLLGLHLLGDSLPPRARLHRRIFSGACTHLGVSDITLKMAWANLCAASPAPAAQDMATQLSAQAAHPVQPAAPRGPSVI